MSAYPDSHDTAGILHPKAKDICSHCKNNVMTTTGKQTVPFCVLYRWNIKKLIDVDGCIPFACTERIT